MTTTEKVSKSRLSFTSKEVTQITQIYSQLQNNGNTTAEIIAEIATTIPKFKGDENIVISKLASMGLIDKPGRRYLLDQDEKEAVERSVDSIYDHFALEEGTPREKAMNRAFRAEFAARLVSDEDEA